ncbi:hypothetical protein QOZ80_9BG0717340 [Eleusine coracana subsp. coracana]|nr:hypothetical protein QOZ80_9BG0717340 [Eleusine coracana subsp. coracana]
MVSAYTGAVNSVITKLATLMGERWYIELTGTDEQELILRDELQVMSALLKQLSDILYLNKEMVECRNHMRELTYDIEDSIDDLLSVNKEGSSSTQKRVMPHDFIDQIQKLNAQLEMADLQNTVSRAEKRTFGPKHMPREQWLSELYYDERLKLQERDQNSVESMRKLPSINYDDLSYEMKTCLLYLSSFPADEVIMKDRLIRRWAAEGFLPKRSMEAWWETGENYFFELIARKLIEPVYGEVEEDILPTGCKISDYVHDFITSLSTYENFVKPGTHGVFWRPLGNPDQSYKEQNRCKVRSLTNEADFGYPWWMPYLSLFKHVRVLDLEGIYGLDEEDLRSVGRLSLLRYLGLAITDIKSLPKEIIALEHLETVDLRHTKLKELPPFKSTKLVYLTADQITLPKEMGEMQILEELSRVHVRDDGSRLAKVVNQSKRLRRLGVRIDSTIDSAVKRKGLMDLLSAIGDSNIHSLWLEDLSTDRSVLDLLLSCWVQQRPRHLQKLQLRIHCPKVPRNISPSLTYLTHLRIVVEKWDTEGLCILGNLPNLVFLSLQPRHTTERSIISKDGFRSLRVFWYDSLFTGRMGLQFKAGAMPQLRRLRLEFNPRKTMSISGGVDFGIQFLTCLARFDAIIDYYGSTDASLEAVEAAMRGQVSQNPNNPMMEIKRRREELLEGVENKDRKSPMFPY